MSPRISLKIFEVRFSVTDVYTVPVRAAGKPTAIAKAKALYGRYGEDADHGIHLDICDGDVHDWEAEEVAS